MSHGRTPLVVLAAFASALLLRPAIAAQDLPHMRNVPGGTFLIGSPAMTAAYSRSEPASATVKP